MNESQAWLAQAMSDLACAERVRESGDPSMNCHVVAKCQQAVEKSVKGLVAGLRQASFLKVQIGPQHSVLRFMSAILRKPRSDGEHGLHGRLIALFNEHTRGEIQAIEALIPRFPGGGASPVRNTEYPFRSDGGAWSYPAYTRAFSPDEVARFRDLARRVVSSCARLESAVRRAP